MRVLLLIAGAGILVSACNRDESVNDSVRVEEGLTANDIVANDTTAIDAATNDAADMAEDVNFTLNDAENLTENADSLANASGNAE